jgi:hypothetical protein
MFPPGRFPPITGRLMFPGKVVGRLVSMLGRLFALLFPRFGRSMVPGSVVGRLPPSPGVVIAPGSVVGRLTLPSDGRSRPTGREGRVSPIPVDGRVVGS